MDFRKERLGDLAARVRTGELPAKELTQHALERIEELNPMLNAFVALDAERALEEASAVDAQVAAGDDPGPLAGIPIGVKDLEDAAGFITTYGSAVHSADPPATADSTLVARLRAAGCVVLGKTNTPELGWKGDTDNPVFGASRNPWSLERSPGGSSGGSGAAVAAGMVPLATGSDGGGSIRIPAALCGLPGMKPSLGRVPAGGPDPPAWPLLSTRGPMAVTVADTVLALECVVGPEPSDLRSLPMPDVRWRHALDDVHPPHRVGWAPTLGYAAVDREIRDVCERAVRSLESLGTEVVEIGRVFDEDPVVDWLAMTGVGHLRSLEQAREGEAWDQVDAGLRTIVEWAAQNVSAVDFLKVEDACHRLNVRLTETLAGLNVLLTPTVAAQTPRSGEPGTIDGQPNANWVALTYPFNMTRSPAGTVCVGFTADGMPVGLQVVGPQHGDIAVLRSMALLERTLAVDAVADLGWARERGR